MDRVNQMTQWEQSLYEDESKVISLSIRKWADKPYRIRLTVFDKATGRQKTRIDLDEKEALKMADEIARFFDEGNNNI